MKYVVEYVHGQVLKTKRFTDFEAALQFAKVTNKNFGRVDIGNEQLSKYVMTLK